MAACGDTRGRSRASARCGRYESLQSRRRDVEDASCGPVTTDSGSFSCRSRWGNVVERRAHRDEGFATDARLELSDDLIEVGGDP
jgi:hypothetical protein